MDKTFYETIKIAMEKKFAQRLSVLFSLFFLSLSLMFIFLPEPLPSMDYTQTYTNLSLGEKISPFSLQDTLNEEDRRYLGMKKGMFDFNKKKFFFLKEIQADYIILEFLNRYCVSCLSQAPIINRLYQKILHDESLRDRIKILGIGVGNNQKEMHQFRSDNKVSFPMLPDPEFAAYEAIGDPGGTPYFLVLRKAPEGELLAESRLGLIENEDLFLDKLKELLHLDLVSFKRRVRERMKLETRILEHQIFLSEEDVREKIKQRILQGDKQQQLSLRKKNITDYGEIYMADIISSEGKKRWFVKVYIRSPVCDVCHPVYFLLIFSEQGIVTDFTPLYITKYGNSPLVFEDIQKLRGKIIGRDLEKTYQFQPEYDSITGATMSVSLVFNSLNKAKGLYKKLQKDGYMSEILSTPK